MTPRSALSATVLFAFAAYAQDQGAHLTEFQGLLSIPNVASDTVNIRRNAEWIRQALTRRGIQSRLLEVAGAPPVVYGELLSPGARRTIVFYAHYDGQPADAKQWKGSPPWEPSFRGANPNDPEARLYARSSADDKAPIMAMLAALDRLKAFRLTPTVNLKFVFEGEEEAGSAHLGQILAANRSLIQADYWLICDGPVHQTRRQQIYFGARGVTGLNLTVHGAARELHSGHYGNWSPNPAVMLAHLIASMRDENGQVLIPGFHDGIEPLSAIEKRALAAAPDIDATLMKELQLARVEAPGVLDVINRPSLNIRGLRAAGVDEESRNVVPASATVSIDIRLVKGNDPARMVELLRNHVASRGYTVLDHVPSPEERLKYPRIASIAAGDHGYRAVRTSMDLPASREIIAAIRGIRPDLILLPTLGGSVPLALIEDVVKVPMIGLPIVNHDNNQHAANENLRLKNLWDGVDLFQTLFRLQPAN
jgi:acetylornithine deacetylase/succinyl-diaminopimelate desuccinylase-like protein